MASIYGADNGGAFGKGSREHLPDSFSFIDSDLKIFPPRRKFLPLHVCCESPLPTFFPLRRRLSTRAVRVL